MGEKPSVEENGREGGLNFSEREVIVTDLTMANIILNRSAKSSCESRERQRLKAFVVARHSRRWKLERNAGAPGFSRPCS